MQLRGIRGATTAAANGAAEILEATRELLVKLQEANRFTVEDIASAIFTMTPDLDAAFPAQAARDLGWSNVPLLCAAEIPVPGGLPYCIRVLVHVHTLLGQEDIRHLYLRGASILRPDLVRGGQG